ncbi:hypothetical protein GCM10023169_13540 [Georgenia halophila]|uniref:Uncharacterized protein n=1 Tax=Georgenia halophila TaxID=620889 RepID=A0ABP8KW29_9MICO
MHPASKKCVVAAVILAVVGFTLSIAWRVFLERGMPALWGEVGGYDSPSEGFYMTMAWLSPMMASVERVLLTVAGALVGAAVVIQVLAPRMESIAEAAEESGGTAEELAEEVPGEFSGEFREAADEPERPKTTYDPRSYRRP